MFWRVFLQSGTRILASIVPCSSYETQVVNMYNVNQAQSPQSFKHQHNIHSYNHHADVGLESHLARDGRPGIWINHPSNKTGPLRTSSGVSPTASTLRTRPRPS